MFNRIIYSYLGLHHEDYKGRAQMKDKELELCAQSIVDTIWNHLGGWALHQSPSYKKHRGLILAALLSAHENGAREAYEEAAEIAADSFGFHIEDKNKKNHGSTACGGCAVAKAIRQAAQNKAMTNMSKDDIARLTQKGAAQKKS